MFLKGVDKGVHLTPVLDFTHCLVGTEDRCSYGKRASLVAKHRESLNPTGCRTMNTRRDKLKNKHKHVISSIFYYIYNGKILCIVSSLPIGNDDTLQWRHDGPDGVSNHQPHECLLKRLFRRRSKKTSKLRVTGLCAGIHRSQRPVTRNMFPFDDVIMTKHKNLPLLTTASILLSPMNVNCPGQKLCHICMYCITNKTTKIVHSRIWVRNACWPGAPFINMD